MIDLVSLAAAAALFRTAKLAQPSYLQSDKSDSKTKIEPLISDRPGFSNGPSIVQAGHFQIETGIHQQQGNDFTLTDFGDGTVVRYGLISSKLEARINVPSYRVLLAADHTVGLSDSGFGVKYFLQPGKGKTVPSLSVLAQTSIISGATDLRSDRWIPEARLLANFALDDTKSLTVNLGYIRNSDFAGGTFDTKEFGFLYSVTMSNWSPYAELFGFLNSDGANTNTNYVQVGTAYAYSPLIQFDASFAKGMNGFSRDVLFSVGVAIKF